MHKTVANKTGGEHIPLNEQEKAKMVIDEIADAKLIEKDMEDAIIKQKICDRVCASAGLTQKEFDILFIV